MLKLAQSEPGIALTPDELDADRFQLNVANGTLDLRAGKLFPHDPDDLITKLGPTQYVPDAPCPLWLAFLDRVMGGDGGMIEYLQRIIGLCLTGDASVQELFILHGGGQNGKNVFLDTISAILGDYAAEAPPDLLTTRGRDEHPTEVADLAGKRLVIASETDEDGKLRVQLVKRLTGNARLKARYMRQDYFEFDRTHKLVLVTNNKPVIREATHAIWRRIRLIPFTVTIPESERDPHLTEKMRAEHSGILAWAVAGCLNWQRAGGLQPPTLVVNATADYQTEQNPVADFVRDRLVIGPGRRVTRAELFSTYQSWAQQIGEKNVLSRNALFAHVRRLDGISESDWRPTGCNIPARGFVGAGLATV